MGFEFKTLHLGETEHYVWQRDTGNLLIVVIDDQCGIARANPEEVTILDETILPLLREYACSWEDTRAIGFFRLMGSEPGAKQVLDFIREWLSEVTTPNIQEYFLVDALYGSGVAVGTTSTIIGLSELYPHDHTNRIAYLTKGTSSILGGLPTGYKIFLKGNEADWAQRHNALSPELMSFFGLSSDFPP